MEKRSTEVPSIYNYVFDRHIITLSIIHIVIYIILAVLLYFLYEGGYLSAWFITFIVALMALMTLSIPRRVEVYEDRVSIHCILELTDIDTSHIVSVRKVDAKEMKWIVPLFGGYGFFGYYGHFLALKRLEHITIYASQWRNFVEITDIYEDKCYIGGVDADSLISYLTGEVEE